MKNHNSLGYSDPDSGMVSESVFGRDSVASSFGSGSCSCSSRPSARSSLSAASNKSRRKRKGRRRIFNSRSPVTGLFNIDCPHCQERVTSSSSLQSPLGDGHKILQEIDCPRCSKRLFQGTKQPSFDDLPGVNLDRHVSCHKCKSPIDRLLQPVYAYEEHVFTCNRCRKPPYIEDSSETAVPMATLATSRHEHVEHGREATPPPLLEPRFSCTFCPQTFKYKYSWERHETSIHSPQKVWICMAKGPTMVMDIGTFCVFCSLPFPSHDHLASRHNYAPCLQRQISERTFERKDGLQQHLKGVHNHTTISPYMTENWLQHNITGPWLWRCGICNESFNDWEVRLKHIGQHWDNGLDMTDWVHKDSLREVSADVRVAPSSELVEQHSVLHKRPESPSTAPVPAYYAMQQLEEFDRGGFEAPPTSTARARPVSKQAETFSWKGIFKRFQRA